ncbi:MAG TPA: hypothetical protein VK957_03490 [Lunatimonas sp.]|nr:hypothetical protein [Lunatimonas sp.]
MGNRWFILSMLLFISFSCQSISENPDSLMEEEVFFVIEAEGKTYSYTYRLPEKYLDVEGGMGFVEPNPGAGTQNFLVFVDPLGLMLIDVDANCNLDPGDNSCFFANLSFTQSRESQKNTGIISFLFGNYTLNKQKTNDPDIDVFFEVDNIRTSPTQRLMEGNFKGRLFTRSPSGRIPENTPRVDVKGAFRVGIIGDVWQLSNPDRNEFTLKK